MTEKTLLVELTRVIPAAAEELFDAWLDPEAMAAFLSPLEGVSTRVAHVDARVGGGYALTMHMGETVIPIEGEYRVVERPARLAFTWLSDRTLPGSLVTLTFERLAEESTRMTLRHVGFPDEETREDHARGWARIAEELSSSIAKR